MRATARFQDPLIVGPRRVYKGLVDSEIVDVEGPLVATLARAVETIERRFAQCAAVAISTCDILPTADEISQLLALEFDPHPHCRFWWQWVVAQPEALGASGWKPSYAIRRADDLPPEIVYPGHLVVLCPRAVRLELLTRLLTLAYRNRNRPLTERVLPMLAQGIWSMMQADARGVLRGQLPLLTATIPWQLWRAYQDLHGQRLTFGSLERRMALVLLHRRFRREPRPVVVAVTRILSFAQDIDTRAEWIAARDRIDVGR